MKKVLAFIAAALLGLSAELQSYAQNGYKMGHLQTPVA